MAQLLFWGTDCHLDYRHLTDDGAEVHRGIPVFPLHGCGGRGAVWSATTAKKYPRGNSANLCCPAHRAT